MSVSYPERTMELLVIEAPHATELLEELEDALLHRQRRVLLERLLHELAQRLRLSAQTQQAIMSVTQRSRCWGCGGDGVATGRRAETV